MMIFIWRKTRGVNRWASEDVAEKPYENGLQKMIFFFIFDIYYAA